jgi:hypothetical protein
MVIVSSACEVEAQNNNRLFKTNAKQRVISN